jgi:hypothetical protein
MLPHRYTQQPHDEAGFLLLSGQPQPRGSRRPPVNHSALQTLVAQRWQDVADDRAAALCADRHHRAWLLRRSLAGLALEVQRTHALSRAALVQYQKSQFLVLGKAFSAWYGRLLRRRDLAEKQRQVQGLQARLSALHACQALRNWAARRKAHRHALTRAACYYSFSSLAKAVDAWRGWLWAQRGKQRKNQLATAHSARRMRLGALRAWRRWAQQRQRSGRQWELAAGFNRVRVLSAALAAWRAGVGALQDRRQQAELAIQRALFGLDLPLLALSVRGWHLYVAARAGRRDSLYIAQRLHRSNTMQRCWQG